MNRRGTVRHRSRPASVAEPTILPDSPLEEAGFELFVPLRINASPSGWSRARIPHGAPEGSFSVAGPLVRIHLPPAKSLQTIGSSAAEPITADGSNAAAS